VSFDLITTLAERRDKITARFKAGFGNSTREIRALLDALDHPASYYAALDHETREGIRTDWQALAMQQGVNLGIQKPKTRPVPPAPAVVVEFFGEATCLPHRPLATNDYTRGCKRRSLEAAAWMRSIQLNTPTHVHWLLIDCDHADTDRWQRAGLPHPSFVTINPSNGHHHVAFRLAAPVCTTDRARREPQRYLRAIREALRDVLNGDEGYTGLLTKNPLHPSWRVVRPSVMPSYTLADLAKCVDLRAGRKNAPRKHDNVAVASLENVEIGRRNKALFDVVRKWAYVHASGAESIFQYAEKCNSQFPSPLPISEVNGIAASIARYCNSQGFVRRRSRDFIARQSERGRRGGRPRTTRDAQPWLAEGISRATWYRRQKALRET
jgi:hypothetical protein